MVVARPGGAFVVEVGEGALLEVGPGYAGRVEPGTAFVVEGLGGDRDGDDARILGWFGSRLPWGWKGFEVGSVGVAATAFCQREIFPLLPGRRKAVGTTDSCSGSESLGLVSPRIRLEERTEMNLAEGCDPGSRLASPPASFRARRGGGRGGSLGA